MSASSLRPRCTTSCGLLWALPCISRITDLRTENNHWFVSEVFCAGVGGSIQGSPEAIYTEQYFRPSDPGIIRTDPLSNSPLTWNILCMPGHFPSQRMLTNLKIQRAATRLVPDLCSFTYVTHLAFLMLLSLKPQLVRWVFLIQIYKSVNYLSNSLIESFFKRRPPGNHRRHL